MAMEGAAPRRDYEEALRSLMLQGAIRTRTRNPWNDRLEPVRRRRPMDH